MSDLDYEGALGALQSFIGAHVRVMVDEKPAEGIPLQSRAALGGVLRFGRDTEHAEIAKEVVGEDAVIFIVGGGAAGATWGSFILREGAFRGARWMETSEGHSALVLILGWTAISVERTKTD